MIISAYIYHTVLHKGKSESTLWCHNKYLDVKTASCVCQGINEIMKVNGVLI